MINCVNYLVMFTLLRHQYAAVARILDHSVNLTFRPKSGFKTECRDRVRASKRPFTNLIWSASVKILIIPNNTTSAEMSFTELKKVNTYLRATRARISHIGFRGYSLERQNS